MNNTQLIEKYSSLLIDADILHNLRYLKNEKNLYIRNDFKSIFTDVNKNDFYETLIAYQSDGNTLFYQSLFNDENVKRLSKFDNYEEDIKVVVSLPDYINAIILRAFIKQIDADFFHNNSRFYNCFLQFQTSTFTGHLLNKKPSQITLLDTLCIVNYKLTKGLYAFNANFYQSFLLNYLRETEIFFDVLKTVENLLLDLKFNTLLNCNVYKCCLSGMYFHKNNLLSFYNIKDNENVFEKLGYNNKYKLNRFFKPLEDNYIYRYFVSNVLSQSMLFTTKNYLELNNVEHGNLKPVPEIKYIKRLNTCLFSDDNFFKTTNYLTKFKTNNNKLRSCYEDPLKILDKLYFIGEDKKNTQLYGIELECFSIEGRSSPTIIKDIEEDYLKGLAICKSDGSIGDNGIEIVTTPMSFNFIKNNNIFHDFYLKIKDVLGSWSSQKTGVHIHVSRDTLTKLQILRVISFINNSFNFNYIRYVCGRPYYNNEFCQVIFKDKNIKELSNDLLKEYPDLIYTTKYSAVNLSKKSTIELRIFKGNIRSDVINRYIEFTDGLINYVKNTPVKLNDFISFMEFIDENKEIYPKLYAYTQLVLVKNGRRDFKKEITGYKFIKQLEKRNINYKPITFELLETVKIHKVKKARTVSK